MQKARSFFAILFVLSVASVKAQTYSTGTNVISAGIGLGSSIAGYTYGSQSPAISLQYERGVWNAGPGVVSLGGYAGFKSYKFSDGPYTAKWNYTIIGVRGAYHYTGLEVKKLDVYGGLMLAYNILKYSDNYSGATYTATGSYGSSLGFSVFVGGRYHFSDNLAAFAELGYGVAYLNLGLAFTF